MSFFSPFLESLILLGALQGFILTGMLLYSKRSGKSNRILAILILVISLANLSLYVTGTDWFSRSQILPLIFALVPMVFGMAIGPLIYFYIRSYSEPLFEFKKKYRVHFYPVIIDLVPQITAFIYISGLLLKWFPKNGTPWGHFIDQYNTYADIPRWLSVSIYVWVSSRYVRSLKNQNEETQGQFRHQRWLRQFILAFTVFQAIWFLFLIPYCIPKYSAKLMDLVNWYPIYIPLSIMIYWLGIKGWLAGSNRSGSENIKIRKGSLISADLSSEVTRRLRKAMEEEKLWLDPSLNLSQLTKHTGIPSKTISAVLNQQLHKSFNEFINGYRVDAIKERLLSATEKNLTIAGLAYECGFNSQPTFQRAFKSIQGESPSEFLSKRQE